ncbi:MAG: TetR/AcrR family transcriptional regulator [Saprospiraceae bacterium]|nr:TetR/AcrR family transcriptional regulator [Lewinella sp.]
MSRRKEILLNAKRLFNENGYSDVGVRELARLLEISPGNLSYHFSKKEDILIALLEDFSRQNTTFYEDYNQSPPSLSGFLTLMKNIFQNQYDYRGVFIGNPFVQNELLRQERFPYPKIVEKRRDTFRQIFSALEEMGYLKFSSDDVEFLVSFTTLFGRFWISEATLFHRSPDKDEVVNHYVALFARQLSLFATKKGKDSIEAFFE